MKGTAERIIVYGVQQRDCENSSKEKSMGNRDEEWEDGEMCIRERGKGG